MIEEPTVVTTSRPSFRTPRALIKVNGEKMSGWIEWTTEENTFYQADTFRVVFAESALPEGRGRAWFAGQTEFKVEIFSGNPADPNDFDEGELESVFYGRADDFDLDMTARKLELYGRDLTGLMIDTKTSEKFPNLTASKIAEKIAGKHGLTPKVKATTTKVGKYYATERVRLQTEQTEWDLLTWLAREEGFLVFVRGKELHFKPLPEDGDPMVIEWVDSDDGGPPSLNATSLRFSRAMTLSKSLKVTVRTWNAKQKKAFTKTATKGAASTGGPVQEYAYTIPGLDAAEAQARADQIAAELSAHEMRVMVDGPARNSFHVDDKLQVKGTGTAFDQVYYPDSITRRQRNEEGMTWSIGAKNRGPETESAQ